MLSSPAEGATNAALGLAAGGDAGGDAAVAWVQGTGAGTQIVVDQLYQPPGAATVSKTIVVLQERAAGAQLDAGERPVGTDHLHGEPRRGRRSGRPRAARSASRPRSRNGSNTWFVTASNPAGLTAGSKVGRIFVDTVAPVVKVTESGPRRAGSNEILRVSYRDPRAGLGRRHGDDPLG